MTLRQPVDNVCVIKIDLGSLHSHLVGGKFAQDALSL